MQLPYFALSVLSFPSLSFNFIFISNKGQTTPLFGSFFSFLFHSISYSFLIRDEHRICLKMGKAVAMLFIFTISAATTMPILVGGCDSPPTARPPSSSPPGGRSGGPPSVPGTGSSPPGGGNSSCPLDALKVGACLDLLGGSVHLGIGDPVVNQCCPLIQGVAELEAALCLCTTIRLKLLNVNVILPLALELFVQCGVTPPPGFTCPPLN